MPRPKLTDEQKRYRRMATRHGKDVIRYMRHAIFPVCDGDEDMNTELAVSAAKRAAHCYFIAHPERKQ